MNPQHQVCPNSGCGASGAAGQIAVHSRLEGRYRCRKCKRTFSGRSGTALYGLKKEEALVIQVVTLLAYGCPVAAVVAAFGLDERTVRRWWQRSGAHCEQVHQQFIDGYRLNLLHLQADELKVRLQGGIVWIAMVMMVGTRLWLGAAVSTQRDRHLLGQALAYARQAALCRPLLVAVDGLNTYLKVIQRTFRTQAKPPGQRRKRWFTWAEVHIVQVLHQRRGQRGYFRQQIAQGTAQAVADLLRASGGGSQINTAFIERLNATFRQRLACLARRTRHPARQIATLHASLFVLGCVYNLCTYHTSLAVPLFINPRRRRLLHRTPAIAAGWTDHCWSVHELLTFNVRFAKQQPPRYYA